MCEFGIGVSSLDSGDVAFRHVTGLIDRSCAKQFMINPSTIDLESAAQ